MSGVAAANDVVVAPVYTPLVGPTYAGQTVYYGAPAVAQTTYYAPAASVAVAPAPVVAYRPVVVRGPAPVVAYSPVASPIVAYSPVASPVVAYSPVAPMPVVYAAGRPVVVSTKVYVPGQPVRNFFKAITP
jgi:hypothetical protein